MPKILSLIAKREKNKLYTGSVFIVMLEVDIGGGDYIRICHNTEDVTWHGKLFQAFPFALGDVSEETNGADPTVEIKVDNVSRALQYAVENTNGANNFKAILYVVNTEDLANDEPVLEEHYAVQETVCDQQYITFTLGTEYSSRTRRPLGRYMKNNCPFQYKGIRCGYNGAMTSCDKTLKGCRLHSNSSRFGGFPGIDQKGVYIND